MPTIGADIDASNGYGYDRDDDANQEIANDKIRFKLHVNQAAKDSSLVGFDGIAVDNLDGVIIKG